MSPILIISFLLLCLWSVSATLNCDPVVPSVCATDFQTSFGTIGFILPPSSSATVSGQFDTKFILKVTANLDTLAVGLGPGVPTPQFPNQSIWLWYQDETIGSSFAQSVQTILNVQHSQVLPGTSTSATTTYFPAANQSPAPSLANFTVSNVIEKTPTDVTVYMLVQDFNSLVSDNAIITPLNTTSIPSQPEQAGSARFPVPPPSGNIQLPSRDTMRQSNFSDIVNALGINPNSELSGWTFIGCFTDSNTAARTLQEHTLISAEMTPALCTQFCGQFAKPLNFAGVEFTEQCFCDFNIQSTAVQAEDTDCNLPCTGDNTLICGGPNRISIFQNNNVGVGPLPINKAQVGNFAFDGCFTDVVGTTTRTLLESISIAAGVTIESCTSACLANGFTIAGLEIGNECWCGNTLNLPIASIKAPVTDCSRACEADTTEICGAANRLSVYTIPLNVSSTIKPTTTVVGSTSTSKPTSTRAPTSTVEPTSTVIVNLASRSYYAHSYLIICYLIFILSLLA